MNIDQFQRDMDHAQIAREVIEHAGFPVEDALVALNASSEKQRDFAASLRIDALNDIWTTFKKPENKTPEMARAVLRAVNRQRSAKWWCDHEGYRAPRAFYMLFVKTIKEEQNRGDNSSLQA